MLKKNSENTTSVKILKSAQELLSRIAHERGMGKIELVSRLVEWFDLQDKTLQAIILGQIHKMDELTVLQLIKDRLQKMIDIDNLDKNTNFRVVLDDFIQGVKKVDYKILGEEDSRLYRNLVKMIGPDPCEDIKDKKA